MALPLLPAVSEVFVVVAKKAYVPLLNDNDQLLIGNWGALRLALQALLAEDASDFERATTLWAQAKQLLVTEQENLVGAGAQGQIDVSDDFNMQAFPVGL